MSKSTPREKVKKFLEDQLAEYEKFKERQPEIEAKAADKISYAKTKLMQMEPFFAMLLFKMPTMINYNIDTAATDGTYLMYNPLIISEKIMRKDLVFILLHEIAHVFWKHTVRGPMSNLNVKEIFKKANGNSFDPEVAKTQHIIREWNYATDYVINWHINTNAHIPITRELKNKIRFDKKYSDKTSKAVYDEIKTEFDPDKVLTEPQSMFGIGGILPQGMGELSSDEIAVLEKEFAQDVMSAASAAQTAGKLPKGVSDTIDSLYKTTTPWQDIFRTIFTSINKQDYTFMYPNKRYTQHMLDYGVCMPSLYGEEYIDCGFIMDTSGSIGEQEKQILTSELKQILEDYPVKLHVLYCDSKAYVDDVQVLTQEDIRNGGLSLKIKGGGGTNMKPAFDYFRDNQDEYDFQTVICMTDMHLFDWGKLGPEPEFSVYWACLPDAKKDQVPDFGTKINIEVQK